MTVANIQILLKRGNSTISSTYTGPLGELTMDTTLYQLRLHDGATPGGILQADTQDVTSANLAMKGYVDSQSFYSNAKVATYLQYGNIANISIAGNVTATYFLGNGALLTGITASNSNYSNVNVAAYLSTATINTSGNITTSGIIKLVPIAYNSLPLAATAGAGARAIINDSTGPTWSGIAGGGGGQVVPVYSDGTNWRWG